jgi:hypothetical protein
MLPERRSYVSALARTVQLRPTLRLSLSDDRLIPSGVIFIASDQGTGVRPIVKYSERISFSDFLVDGLGYTLLVLPAARILKRRSNIAARTICNYSPDITYLLLIMIT